MNKVKTFIGETYVLEFEMHICHSSQNFLFIPDTDIIWNKILVTKNSFNTKNDAIIYKAPLFFAMNFLAAGVVVVFQGQEIETFDRAWHGTLGSNFLWILLILPVQTFRWPKKGRFWFSILDLQGIHRTPITCSWHRNLQNIRIRILQIFVLIFFNVSATNNLKQILD